MKTTELNNNKASENNAKNNAQKTVKPQDSLKPSLSPKEAKQQPQVPKAEKTVSEQVEMDNGEKTHIHVTPKMIKPALNLEGTLKLVEELHRRKIQRDKLIDTIDTLEQFEVAQKDDADETDGNHFQGCKLSILDDKRREFVTKNPYIIQRVAAFINNLCIERLMDIESEIQLPA